MAIRVLPNQNVKFSLDGQDFNTLNKGCMQDNELWCQLAEPQVVTMFEGELTPVTGDELLTNSHMTSALTPWVQTSGFWFYTPVNDSIYGQTFPGTSQGNLRQTLALTDGKIYRFSVQVNTSANARMLLNFVGGGTYLSNNIFNNVQPGYYEIYFMADSTSGVQITVISSNNTGRGEISLTLASLLELSTPDIAIYDCEGNFVTNITDIEYSFSSTIAFAVAITWGELGLANNCYRICLSDVDDLNEDLLLPSLFIIASNGQPLLAGVGDTNANTNPDFKDRVNTKVDPTYYQGNKIPLGIKYMG